MRLSISAQPSFADLELQAQTLAMDEVLQAIDAVLEEQAELVELVRQDLVRGRRKPQTGRDGLTAEQTLRAFVVKQVKNCGVAPVWWTVNG